MIIDDAAFMRLTLKNMLEKNGFTVVAEADTGATGVRKYQEYHPDIVTMDITMPEMDGITALKEITKIDPNAKVVMMSAMGQESFIREAISHGAKYFLVKPFKEPQVLATLKKISAT